MGQKQQLIWDLPALDSLRINAAVYDISDAELKQRVGELNEMLDPGRQAEFTGSQALAGRADEGRAARRALIHRPQGAVFR